MGGNVLCDPTDSEWDAHSSDTIGFSRQGSFQPCLFLYASHLVVYSKINYKNQVNPLSELSKIKILKMFDLQTKSAFNSNDLQV